MMNKKLVTVVMPVYNGLPYVIEAIESILNQTHKNIEFIVINDCSIDGTTDALSEYKDRLTLISNEKNLGIYETMNRGISIARGEYIALYHADDIYLPNIVEKEAEFLDKYQEAGAVFCADIFIDRFGKEYGGLELPEEVRGNKPLDYKTIINAELTYKNTFLVCPTCMVRKSVHENVGLYNQERYKNSADLEMYLRIAKSCKIGILEDYLLLYRHGHDTSSRRYHHLRTDPQRFFMIMDDVLAAGASEVAEQKSLMYYESHRHQEYIMCAISAYIKEDIPLCRSLLEKSSAIQLLKSNKIQRFRMIILLYSLLIISHLPHSSMIARIFYNRWHRKTHK